VGAPATLPPRPVTAKDPPAPLDFLRRVLPVTSQKTVANQETHAVTVRTMGPLQVPAALVKVRRVGHIRGHLVHGSPRCAPAISCRQAPAGARANPAPCVRSLRSLTSGPGYSLTTTPFSLYSTILIPSQFHPFLRSHCGKAHVRLPSRDKLDRGPWQCRRFRHSQSIRRARSPDPHHGGEWFGRGDQHLRLHV